jgi:hypothetical protein
MFLLSLYAAKPVTNLLPALVAYARCAPEQVVRFDCPLDGQQSWVVGTPEGVLEVRFVGVGLGKDRDREGQRSNVRKGAGTISGFMRTVFCSPREPGLTTRRHDGSWARVTTLAVMKLYRRR